eukprot:280953-Pyramimonas_sp.AAC.1
MATIRESGAVPISMTDPNGALPHSPLDNVAGTFGTGKITPASARSRPYLHGREMTSATTHFKGPPAYVGEKDSSYIDHVFVPQDVLKTIEGVHILTNSARRLQLIRSMEPRDHRPVLVTMLAQLSSEPLPRRPPRPNK